jgi:dienelactone hydrolase
MKNILATVLVLGAVLCSTSAEAKVKTETVVYKQGKVTLEGVLAYDDATTDRRPAVLVVHDWMGIGNHTRATAERLAGMGYVAFAVDIYGKGKAPKSFDEAGKLAGQYKGDRKLLRARVRAGFDWLGKHKLVDATRIAAIGFCFGGTTALELARAGAPVAGVISFHGGLDSPTPADARNIKGKVLVLHGAADPYVPPDQVAAFQKEMDDAKVDWQLIAYSGAVHAFTNPDAGNDPSKGAAYDARTDARAWAHAAVFFAEIFKK